MDRPEDTSRTMELRLLPLCVVLGLVVGALVAGMRVAVSFFAGGHLAGPVVLVVVLPALGLLISGLLLQYMATSPDPHDTEGYIEAYHSGRIDGPRDAFAKTAAALATVGFGGAAGLEGPSMYAGMILGGWLQPLLRRLGVTDRRALRSLLIAGAAAGISAVFSAPLTGLVFALEVPYTDDFAKESLVPALMASVSAYLAAVALLGTEPLFPVNHRLVPSLRYVLYAVALGVLLGLVARLLSLALLAAEHVSARVPVPLWVRTLGGGVACGVLGYATLRVYGSPLALGIGYDLMNGAMVAKWVGMAALLLLVLRSAAVLTTLGSGAAGGTFIPFMSMGAVAGAVVTSFEPASGALFPIIGMAAFLGAANATPIAAAVFVAETTGSTGYIIPGLVAATAAYLVAGRKSVSRGQRPSRRLSQPVR